MKKLLMKEFKLASHPTNILFLLLGAMLIIPNYPYYVVFFYTSLGIFFTCLTGRENGDISYTLQLPVGKKDVVASRMCFAVILQILQVVCAVPFAILRQKLLPAGNAVGMDANCAMFGFAFVLMGVYNLVFFPAYYRNPGKVGVAFVKGSIVMFLLMTVMETLVHVIPFFRDVLDGMGGEHVLARVCVLAGGFVVYLGLNGLAYAKSSAAFDTIDL